MRRLGWECSAGVLGIQLLVAACGPSEQTSTSSTGGTDGGGGVQSSSGSAGKATTGGTASGSVGGSAAAGDIDSFLKSEGDRFCARLFRCAEGNDDFSAERIVLKNEQGCKDLLARLNATSRALVDLRAQIAAGNIHYDPQNGQKCLNDLVKPGGSAIIS